MKQFFKTMFASLLGTLLASVIFIFLVIGIIGAIAAISGSDKEIEVKENSVLVMKFDGPITDRGSKNPFANLGAMFAKEKPIGLDEILNNIEKAKEDENIKGIYMEISSIPAGIAMVEEIRNKLLEFKNTGKFILAYSEYYTQGAYYLASVADKIYLNPQGAIDFKGLSAELMFFKNALEKLEVEPQIIRHGKFKSAIEPFILEKMSDENREQTMTYIGSIWNHMVDGISKSRNISAEELNKIADEMSLQKAEDAVKYKFADQLAYKDEILEILKEKTNAEAIDKINSVSIADYTFAKEPTKKEFSKDKIAVIYAIGEIEDGEGDEETIGSERISKAIREARLDEKVKAIVLRVNSPGGSALASEVMWREVVLAKQAKPVIVSMGNVAASGGYYISCAADTIVAEPNTITGSIGVFGVLFNAQGFMNNKLGITFDTVKTNLHADIGSIYRPLTTSERDIIQKSVEHVYDVFITRVAEGRKLTKEQVDEIGQGRVWSGVDAKRIGLVDVLGGLETAIEIAAQKAGLENYKLLSLPKQKDPLEELFSKGTSSVEEAMVKHFLGENAKYYMTLDRLKRYSGIQARMPYEVEIH
ncbi:MAG: signal peptide peptidase SppA [Bacteroidia bacterium]